MSGIEFVPFNVNHFFPGMVVAGDGKSKILITIDIGKTINF
jgi:hypothetical protein